MTRLSWWIFKSEKKVDVNNPKDREKLDRYRRQLEVYAHIVQERTGLEVSKTHLYYTSEEAGSPYITFAQDARSIQKTIAVLMPLCIASKPKTLASRTTCQALPGL